MSEQPEEETEESVTEEVYPCKYCGATESPKYGKFTKRIMLANHVRNECVEYKKFKEKEQVAKVKRSMEAAKGVVTEEEVRAAQPPKPEDLPDRQRVAMYGYPELLKLKRARLEQFLKAAPKVGKPIVDWVLQQWDMDMNVREDPNSLLSLLRDSGINMNIGYRVVNALEALHQDMADVLRPSMPPVFSRRQPYSPQEEHRFPPRRGFPSREAAYPPRYPPRYPRDYEEYDYPPRQVRPGVYEEGRYPPPRRPRRDDFEWQIEKAQKPLLDKIDKLTDAIKDSQKGQQQQQVEIWRPRVNNEGVIETDKDGKPILEKIVAPANMAEKFMPQTDPELLALKKMEYYRTMLAPQGPPPDDESKITAEKIRELIKEDREAVTPEKVGAIVAEKLKEVKPEKSAELAKMEQQLETLSGKLEEQKDQITNERFDRLTKDLGDAKAMIRSMSTGEFKEDSMKILAKSIDTATEILKERKPLEKLVDKAIPEPPAIPPESQPRKAPVKPGPEAQKTANTAMNKLEKEGLVVEK